MLAIHTATENTKTLLIVRHAKSSWDASTVSDFERPLNERGKKDAPAMAQRLLEKKIRIDAFVSSPAKRAKKTAELFCREYGVKEEAIVLIPKLYHAPVEVFYQIASTLDDVHNTVAIFSHNPGITEFVNELVEGVYLDNMPTCAVFAVKIHSTQWVDFRTAKKEFLFFDYPKAL
jgi:phosphohistidine phosphatase